MPKVNILSVEPNATLTILRSDLQKMPEETVIQSSCEPSGQLNNTAALKITDDTGAILFFQKGVLNFARGELLEAIDLTQVHARSGITR